MKLIYCLMLGVICGGMMSWAQEASSNDEAKPQPLSSVEIQQLALSTRVARWAELAKSSKFVSRKSEWGSAVINPISSNWSNVYTDREFKKAWLSEKGRAQLLMQRPCRSDQKRWLEDFIKAADAVEAKDDKAFKELVIKLNDDLKTLF